MRIACSAVAKEDRLFIPAGNNVIKTKLVILKSLHALFKWTWIVAAVACVHYLYETLANEAPIRYLLMSIVVALIAKGLATTLVNSKDENEYVVQLMGYGFSKDEASSAWDIKSNGGSNLLLHLQQADTIVENAPQNDGRRAPIADE